MAGIDLQVRFGDYAFDRRTRQLLKGELQVPLTPKAFALLELLITERPRVVSKREILDRVWPDVIVEEQNVKNLVSEVRTALSDTATGGRFIRNAFGQGYAFCGTVETPSERGSLSAFLRTSTQTFPLLEGTNVVGRSPECDVFIDAEGVSRRHAVITITGEDATVTDAGSKNGTWVNETQIQSERQLSAGDVLRFGRIVATYSIVHSDATETLSAS